MSEETVSIEFINDSDASMLQKRSLDSRNAVIKKGFYYEQKEDECAMSSLKDDRLEKMIRQIKSLESDIKHKDDNLKEKDDNLKEIKINFKSYYDGIEIQNNHRHENTIHRYETLLVTKDTEHKKMACLMNENTESKINAIKSNYKYEIQKLNYDINKETEKTKQAAEKQDLAEAKLLKYEEQFGTGNTSTSGNVQKGNQGELKMKSILEEDMQKVSHLFQPDSLINQSKGTGHKADLFLNCNGSDVLIEVKNSDSSIRKKEIDKAKQDLLDNPNVRVMVMVSFSSSFQDKGISEHELSFFVLEECQFMVYVPNFTQMINDGKRIILAATINSLTAMAKEMQTQNKYMIVPKVLKHITEFVKTFTNIVSMARRIKKDGASIEENAIKNIANCSQLTALLEKKHVEHGNEKTDEHNIDHNTKTDHEIPTEHTIDHTTAKPEIPTEYAANKPPPVKKRNRIEVNSAVASIYNELIDSKQQKLEIDEIVNLLRNETIANTTGYGRTGKHWDKQSIKKQLFSKLNENDNISVLANDSLEYIGIQNINDTPTAKNTYCLEHELQPIDVYV